MSNIIHTESIEHNGATITINWFPDEDMGPPWDNEDGHGPVSDWTSRAKLPGERVLNEDHRSYRYYDFAAAVKLAKKDGWEAKPYKTGTPGERANRAAEADYEWLRRWCNDDWHYCGYQLEVDGFAYEDSLWGIDSDSIDSLTKEAFDAAKAWLDREKTESQWATDHDIQTFATAECARIGA
jgi:hypothetical protein